MSVYSVYEPPPRSADALAEVERFVFVRDGFYWWAFLLTPFWMLRHRLWLVLTIYLIVIAALDTTLHRVGAADFVIAIIAVLVSCLIGFEAGTLRRFTLQRRRWRNVGIVSGDNLEDAERRFFDDWVRSGTARRAAPSSPSPPAPPAPPRPGATGVIGLFPEPGAQR
jgi:hypothetical protein